MIKPEVTAPRVLFPAVRTVVKRLVDEAVVEKRFVVVALLITPYTENRFVEVALVVEALVAKKFVVVAEVPVARRNVKFWRVVELFAKNCWNEETRVVDVALKYGAVTRPVNTPAPVTESGVPGVVVPIPTFPFTTINWVEVATPVDDDAMTNEGVVIAKLCVPTESWPHGVVVPMPTLPLNVEVLLPT